MTGAQAVTVRVKEGTTDNECDAVSMRGHGSRRGCRLEAAVVFDVHLIVLIAKLSQGQFSRRDKHHFAPQHIPGILLWQYTALPRATPKPTEKKDKCSSY